MITKVRFENYRCLTGATLRLGPLTVLVGPNASGKSSVLDALSVRLTGSDGWRHAGKPIVWYHRRGHAESRATRASPIDVRSQRITFDSGLLRGANTLSHEVCLESRGANLANVFGSLTRVEQVQLASKLCEHVPVYDDVDTRPTSGGNHQVVFSDRWADGLWYTPHEVSDGTMLTLGFLTIPYQRQQPDLLLVEEPERGLHPYLMEQVLSLLRELATKRDIQVLVATHSATLLEFALPEEVRFLSRSTTEGRVEVREVPTGDAWDDAFHEYRESLGSLWLSGSLGGVPGG